MDIPCVSYSLVLEEFLASLATVVPALLAVRGLRTRLRGQQILAFSKAVALLLAL